MKLAKSHVAPRTSTPLWYSGLHWVPSPEHNNAIRDQKEDKSLMPMTSQWLESFISVTYIHQVICCPSFTRSNTFRPRGPNNGDTVMSSVYAPFLLSNEKTMGYL